MYNEWSEKRQELHLTEQYELRKCLRNAVKKDQTNQNEKHAWKELCVHIGPDVDNVKKEVKHLVPVYSNE
jgi:hypothetical protein